MPRRLHLMRNDSRSVRPGWAKPALIGLICLLGGLAIGRWVLGRKTSGERVWRQVEELHQMFLVPSGYNFVESNKSYENQLISFLHDQLLHYDPVQNQLVPGLAKTYGASSDG